MTDNTSPVATLAGRLPKGNGLTRAVERLHGQNGALVPFIGFLEIDESGEDKNDVLKIRTSIARLELCTGELEREAKDLLARATTAANQYGGQQQLFADPGTEAEEQEQRDQLLGFLREWQAEQKPPLDDQAAADRWKSFHGGHYDARPEAAKAVHLREFLMSIGALADSDWPATATATGDEAGDVDVDQGDEPDEDLDTPADQPVPAIRSVPFHGPGAA